MKVDVVAILDRRVGWIPIFQFTVAEIIWFALFMVVYASGVFVDYPLIVLIVYIIGIVLLGKRDKWGGPLEL